MIRLEKKEEAIKPLPFPVYYWTVVSLSIFGIANSIYLSISHFHVYTDIGYRSFCAITRVINYDTDFTDYTGLYFINAAAFMNWKHCLNHAYPIDTGWYFGSMTRCVSDYPRTQLEVQHHFLVSLPALAIWSVSGGLLSLIGALPCWDFYKVTWAPNPSESAEPVLTG